MVNVHGVADERRRLQSVLLDEAGHVAGHGRVVVHRGVARLAVVAQVDGVDVPLEVARQDSGRAHSFLSARTTP